MSYSIKEYIVDGISINLEEGTSNIYLCSNFFPC